MSDWWGPFFSVKGYNKEQYVQCFIDVESGVAGTYCSSTKACGAKHLANFKLELEHSLDCSIDILQADYEMVYTDGLVRDFCVEHSIKQRFSAPYSHQQNGIAERFWRTMETTVSALLAYSDDFPTYLWPFAVRDFTRGYNRSIAVGTNITRIELLTGKRPTTSYFSLKNSHAILFLRAKRRTWYASAPYSTRDVLYERSLKCASFYVKHLYEIINIHLEN